MLPTLLHVKDMLYGVGGLHTCTYTSVTKNYMIYLLKEDPKLHRPSVQYTPL
jgi:hypothetical protein